MASTVRSVVKALLSSRSITYWQDGKPEEDYKLIGESMYCSELNRQHNTIHLPAKMLEKMAEEALTKGQSEDTVCTNIGMDYKEACMLDENGHMGVGQMLVYYNRIDRIVLVISEGKPRITSKSLRSSKHEPICTDNGRWTFG